MERDTARPRTRKEIGEHELARLIHTARRARGWTQDELGRRVGVDRDVVSTWERGHRPGRHALVRLVALLDLDLTAPSPGQG
jgi:transcriptional regulator with XRE-family HTH domain